MKFFDPRMRIIMESVQLINWGYVRVHKQTHYVDEKLEIQIIETV